MLWQLIGIGRWGVELGCIDIIHELSHFRSTRQTPNVGHSEGLCHLFAYLKKQPHMEQLAYDLALPAINEGAFDHTGDGWTPMLKWRKNYLPMLLKRVATQ